MVLPGSSDRPVAAGAPLLGIHDMVNRRAASGAPFNAAEAVTAAEAVRAYTYGSAYASKAEHVKGSVTPGKRADLVVVSEDPTAVSPGRIAGLEVRATIVGGEIAYSAQALLTDAIDGDPSSVERGCETPGSRGGTDRLCGREPRARHRSAGPAEARRPGR